MDELIVLTVKRYKCPHCPRSASSRSRATQHMSRCWYNPAAQGCKTCRHFMPPADACGCEPGCNWGGSADGTPEHCSVGVSLAGRPACRACHGTGQTFGDDLGVSECTECGGDAAEIKPGPVVGCDEWEPIR